MSTMEQKYAIHVHPDIVTGSCSVETVMATKHTYATEVVDIVMSRLKKTDSNSYVLVEMHQQRGEEMVLASSDCPVQRMLLWPRQFQHSYKFVLRQVDKDGIVMYKGANKWQAKMNEDSKQRNMVLKGFLPPSQLFLDDNPDLCLLSVPTQEKLLEVLKLRFAKDKIYTYSGEILISINPYKFLAIYNPKFMTMYQSRKRVDLEPHIYAIADSAFTQMVEDKKNQCIVITGKSGSGKTQATHFLVHHTLALCQKSYMTGVEHMLVGCVPVLEALGNAQTEHNNNSSRFGKFLRIYFYESGLLSGADIQTYLLEKSRLVHQGLNERNFHIFYYLLCGASDEVLSELQLDKNNTYNYVKSNMMGNSDAVAELDRLKQAMEVVGFFAGAQKNIFKLISAILLLGNITFKVRKGREESLEIEDESYLLSVSKLLDLDANFVKKCLLTRKAKAGAGERFILDLKLNEAQATRDAMAKALYQSLFDWAVNSINMALAQRTRDSKLRAQSRWIGLLDIFGFEDFVYNSFEQFCINYASEHLQHHCIKHTFQVEQEIYKTEGLEWKEVGYADNSGCLELYEKKPTGLFYLIDENFPGANNQTLLAQFNRVHSSNRYYETTVVKEDAFIINHYAGKVKYQIKNFREKNHDQVREDIILMLRTSKSSFIQDVISNSPAAVFRWATLRAVVRAASAFKNSKQLMKGSPRHVGVRSMWSGEKQESKEMQYSYVHKKMRARLSYRRNGNSAESAHSNSSSGGSFHGSVGNPYIRDIGSSMYGKRKNVAASRSKKKTNSIGQQHQASLASLMGALAKAHPFFVRCIQPNNKKIPRQFDEKLVLHQLRCSGTLQTIQLQQSRYPVHYTPTVFLQEYRLLFPPTTNRLDLKQIDNFLVLNGLQQKTHFQVGSSTVFLRTLANNKLRESLHYHVLSSVILCQACARRFLARRRYLQAKRAAVKIQSFYRMVEVQRQIEEWHLAASIIQDAWQNYQRRNWEVHIVRLQAHCRGFLTRLNVRRRNRSAGVIQATWRTYIKRRNAAVCIQKFARGFLAKQSAQNMIERSYSTEDVSVELDQSHSGAVSRTESEPAPYASQQPDIVSIRDTEVQVEPSITSSLKTDEHDEKVKKVSAFSIGSPEKKSRPSHVKLHEEADQSEFCVADTDTKPDEISPTLRHVKETYLDQVDYSKVVDHRLPAPGRVEKSSSGLRNARSTESVLEDVKNMRKTLRKQLSAGDLLSAASRTNQKNSIRLSPSLPPTEQPTATLTNKLDTDLCDSGYNIDVVLKPKERTPEPSKSLVNNLSDKLPDVPSLAKEQKIVVKSKGYQPKAGEMFLRAATPKRNKKAEVVRPVSFQPSAIKRNEMLDKIATDSADGWIPFMDDDAYNLVKQPKENDPGTFRSLTKETDQNGDHEVNHHEQQHINDEHTPMHDQKVLKKSRSNPESGANTINLPSQLKYIPENVTLQHDDDVLHPDDIFISTTDDVKEISQSGVSLKSLSLPHELKRKEEIAQLHKEYLAFQKVERERQLRDLAAVHDSRRDNKRDRKIRDELTSLRLEQMSILKEKMDEYGLSFDSMPDLAPLSRTASDITDTDHSTPPTTPLSPQAHVKVLVPEKKSPSTDEANFPRSISMESISRTNSRPRRQRSNSAIEIQGSRTPSSDPMSRKFAKDANAFAKKYSEEERASSNSSLAEEVDDKAKQPVGGNEVKRGTFMAAVRKTFLGTHKGRHHNNLSEKKSGESANTSLNETVGSVTMTPSSVKEEGESVKFRSLVAEEVSTKMFLSRTDELSLLDSFIKEKMQTFVVSNVIDQVFQKALDEFCINLTAVYSLTELSGGTNGLRYKDIINNFRQVLDKTATAHQIDEYAAMMAVNGFRGYMNEFMNDVLPKHVTKESRVKRKKSKDDVLDKLGHTFSPVQWGVTQVCESCNSVMWLMESGLVCKICKFACHKRCLKQLTQRCAGSPEGGKDHSKPKKLFGEALVSLVTAADSSVPVFVDKCISYMEMNGIYQEGIYRKSAAATQIKQLEEALNKDIECDKVNFDDYQIHTVAAVFKKFLRALTQPLVPFDKYFEFLQASKLTNEHEKVNSLFSVLEGIPSCNYATLERIVFHLARVAQQEPTNRMSPNNLAIVFTPCFISPPIHVPPIEAASQLGDMTKGVEVVITEQVQKIRKTLESISEIKSVESSTSERLQKIRQSMGKGKRKRIRPSFREGPRSPVTRRSFRERHLDSVDEEDVDLAQEERMYEERIQTLRNRKETLTSKLPSLTPQNPNRNAVFFDDDQLNDMKPASHHQQQLRASSTANEYLRHLNKRRVTQLPPRRRPTRYSSPIFNPAPAPPAPKEGKPLRRVSAPKGKLKRFAKGTAAEEDSFTRSSVMRNPIHHRHKKPKAGLSPAKRLQMVGKVTSV